MGTVLPTVPRIVPRCSYDDCERQARSLGLCNGHYKQKKRGLELKPLINRKYKLCSFEGCGREHNSNGYCNSHNWQYSNGKELTPIRGDSNGWLNDQGYVVKFDVTHPNAFKDGTILEHRLVMSEFLGRALLPAENVHHKNGDKADNRIENLELWSKSQPQGQRAADKLAWAREIIELYGPDEEKL